MAGPTLSEYISRKRIVPEKARLNPYFATGNILLLTERNAFRFDKHTLTSQSAQFKERIKIMNDGNTDVVEGAVVLELPSWVDPCDLSAFLDALWEAPESWVLDTLEDFHRLAGVLRLSTFFGAPVLRTAIMAALQIRYPTTLEGWDHVRPPISARPPPRLYDQPWEYDRALIINLARQVGAYSILPAAMAMLANDRSAGEVFGVRLPSQAQPELQQSIDYLDSPITPISAHPTSNLNVPQMTPLNSTDAPSFALTKEHSHLSSISLLLAIRSLSQTCTRPPQRLPLTAGRAPVGSSILLPGSSQCLAFFKQTASRLLEGLVLEDPVGFPDFAPRVLSVEEDPTRVCRVCWKAFKELVREARERWWRELPGAVRFAETDTELPEWVGWEDKRLQSVEV